MHYLDSECTSNCRRALRHRQVLNFQSASCLCTILGRNASPLHRASCASKCRIKVCSKRGTLGTSSDMNHALILTPSRLLADASSCLRHTTG